MTPGQANSITANIEDHDHDEDYSAIDHDHDSDYAAATHNHDADYAADDHDHDSDYAAATHNHDADYAADDHNHDSDYAAATHNHDADYAADDHNHDSDYAPIGKGHPLRGVIMDPAAAYALSTFIPIWLDVDADITISKIALSCDADPTTELDVDLVFVDAFIGKANLTVIDVLDTSVGVAEITSGFDDATVPAGKCIGLRFGAEPDADINALAYQVEFSYD